MTTFLRYFRFIIPTFIFILAPAFVLYTLYFPSSVVNADTFNERSYQLQSLIDARHYIELYPSSRERQMVLDHLDNATLWLQDLETKQLT